MTLPSFDEVYLAAHGYKPFPWQRRLVRDILAGRWPDNRWPEVLDLPTGTGKTTALDIALYCLAAAPEIMPRRVVLVVDRRIVVDQGARHARELQRALAGATSGPLKAFADALRALWGGEASLGEPPFAVAVMRGGVPRDNDWARRPDQPVLGVSTIDQLGSRLLFRGYGISSRSASIHAGLVGNDTLILLDEVHLATAFAETLAKIRARFRGAGQTLPQRFAVTQMSATVRPAGGDGEASARSTPAFGLDDDDRAEPTLDRRLRASKRAELRVAKVTGDAEAAKLEAVARRAVHEARALQAAGARTVAIVVNRVDTARMATAKLAEHTDTDAVLLTGRMRPIERDHAVAAQLLPRAGAGRTRSADARPLIVVATQCIEAGADLDFDAMVSECASLDALRQRFGRVDRRGELRETRSILLARSDQIAAGADDPVYGEALGATWRWLTEHAADDAIDFGITALQAILAIAEPPRSLWPDAVEVPVLLPAHLDAWAQTSQPPAADPDISLWLHGATRPGADVQVIWRASADIHRHPGALDQLLEHLEACRPSALEAVTVPLAAARRWLESQLGVEQPGDAISDVEGEEAVDEPRRRAEPNGTRVLRWAGEDSEVIWPRGLRPGDTLIVDAAHGGLWRGSFAPAHTAPLGDPGDLGDLAQLRGRGIASLRLSPDALAVWHFPATMITTVPAVIDDEPPEDTRKRVASWLAGWPEAVPETFIGTPAEWRAARAALQADPRIAELPGQLIATAPADLAPEIDDALTEDDDSSFRTAEISLDDHSKDVQRLAAEYARRLGLATALGDDLALAAWLHDVGKADPRFQRWLAGGSDVRSPDGPLLAKSAMPAGSRASRLARARARYPTGYRHELLSLAMVQDHPAALATAHDRDLVLHLVASHHGWCRPFPPAVVDPEPVAVRAQHGDHELTSSTGHTLARLDGGVAERFWTLVERYGWWGLAWLEAIVRLADHRASEQPERRRQGGLR